MDFPKLYFLRTPVPIARPLWEERGGEYFITLSSSPTTILVYLFNEEIVLAHRLLYYTIRDMTVLFLCRGPHYTAYEVATRTQACSLYSH
jgi:hypothetical protein